MISELPPAFFYFHFQFRCGGLKGSHTPPLDFQKNLTSNPSMGTMELGGAGRGGIQGGGLLTGSLRRILSTTANRLLQTVMSWCSKFAQANWGRGGSQTCYLHSHHSESGRCGLQVKLFWNPQSRHGLATRCPTTAPHPSPAPTQIFRGNLSLPERGRTRIVRIFDLSHPKRWIHKNLSPALQASPRAPTETIGEGTRRV